MPLVDPATWSASLRHTLEHYDEPLLRQVAQRLCKPRNQWPESELIERCLAAAGNPAVIDRRLSDLDQPSLQLLALIGHSRQPHWRVGNLVEMAVALGHDDGLAAVVALLEAGLVYPYFGPPPEQTLANAKPGPKTPRVRTFDRWLGQTASVPPTVFALPEITERALHSGPEFPECPGAVQSEKVTVQEADGLDWPLALAALWQQVHASPLRRTQSTGFFKRDLERLRGDTVLSGVGPDRLTEVPDSALLLVSLAVGDGLLVDSEGEVRGGAFPESWNQGLPAAITSLWQALLAQENWDPQAGWRPEAEPATLIPSTWLLALVLLSRLPTSAWADVEALEKWMSKHHPAWRGGKRHCGLETFLLGVAYPLRLVQATRNDKGALLLRLSPLGRWLLGLGPTPKFSTFTQTLLVQPNLEILVYRQGLTPALIARLAKLADIRSVGSACTLQLEPTSVYRALEAGESFETIQQTLQQHGMKPTPDSVISALRTWASKRERIRVFSGGSLFEFDSPDDLTAAVARGLPAVRLSERLAIVANDRDIDYRHFRLTSTRDYALPPERCVDVDADGVTLAIDLSKSDLLVETEARRFAEMLERPSSNGQRWYRATPESLTKARDGGISLQNLETWFQQRSGQALPSAVRLLFTGPQLSPYAMRRPVVLSVPSAEIADGLMQWPETRALIEARLGPTALVVKEEHVVALRQQLTTLGVTVAEPG